MIENKKIILLGAPGSGKGSLAQFLTKKGFVQISTGDLFRKKLSEDTREAQEIQMIVNRGELIPDAITNKLAFDEIKANIEKNKSIILDGYPRTIDQAKFLDTVCKIDYVIYLDVSRDVLFKRITGRLSCKQCGRIYNKFSNPPKEVNVCDDCKIALVVRKDDNEQSFDTRMNEYLDKTKPLIEFYSHHQLAKFISLKPAQTDSIDEIGNTILKQIA